MQAVAHLSKPSSYTVVHPILVHVSHSTPTLQFTFGHQERTRVDNAMRHQQRLVEEQKVQATANRLAGLEAEQEKLLSRVLAAEEEAARQR